MTREYGQFIGSAIDVRDDLRDIGRRLDALEAGRRSDNDLPDDEFQKKAGREVGWYPVAWERKTHLQVWRPECLEWDGAMWRYLDGEPCTISRAPDWIGPRLDLPEGR